MSEKYAAMQSGILKRDLLFSCICSMIELEEKLRMYDPLLLSKNQKMMIEEIVRKETRRLCQHFFDSIISAVTEMIVANNEKIKEDLENLGILPRNVA